MVHLDTSSHAISHPFLSIYCSFIIIIIMWTCSVIESADPSHYLVQFDCDECILIITRKQLLRPPVLVADGECWINWKGEENSAKVLAMGDRAAMKQTETDILKHLHQSDQLFSDEEESSPPMKKGDLALKRKARVPRKKNQNSLRRRHGRLNKSPVLLTWK